MSYRACLIAIGLLAGMTALAQEAPQPPASQDKVAALKQSLQKSAAALRQYEWIETTTVSMKGEEKSKTQNRCYYGADGKVVKVPLAAEPESGGKSPRGLRGKVVENKKEDVKDSVEEAVALVKQYVPPDPAKIQAAKDAGRLTMAPPDAQGKVRVDIKDYLKPGDSLSLALDGASNRLLGIAVASFIDSAKDAVNLNVKVGVLPDETMYSSDVTLEIKEQDLAIAIAHSGYKKAGS